MEENKVRQLNPLVMAFVGDSVFTLYVRERLATESDCKAGVLHKKANCFVKASAQAAVFDKIEADLTEDECSVARRAKNCHNNTHAKNATIYDYKLATAFEAVLGYVKLCEQTDRLEFLLRRSYEIGAEQTDKEKKDE